MFKSEFKAKLESGTEYKELLAYVHDRQATGLGQREACDQLHAIWLQ